MCLLVHQGLLSTYIYIGAAMGHGTLTAQAPPSLIKKKVKENEQALLWIRQLKARRKEDCDR